MTQFSQTANGSAIPHHTGGCQFCMAAPHPEDLYLTTISKKWACEGCIDDADEEEAADARADEDDGDDTYDMHCKTESWQGRYV